MNKAGILEAVAKAMANLPDDDNWSIASLIGKESVMVIISSDELVQEDTTLPPDIAVDIQ